MNAAIRWLRTLTLLTGALVLGGSATPVCLWLVRGLSGPWPETKGGTLLVPAAEMEDAETMGLATYRRAYYARLYWRQGGFSHIVLLGRDAAPAMARWLIHEGVPREAIVVGGESTSTRENAAEARQILDHWNGRPAGPLVLLTSDYHCWRARRVFEAAGVPVIVQPVPDAAKRWPQWTARPGICAEVAVEYAKIAWYWGKGWLSR